MAMRDWEGKSPHEPKHLWKPGLAGTLALPALGFDTTSPGFLESAQAKSPPSRRSGGWQVFLMTLCYSSNRVWPVRLGGSR